MKRMMTEYALYLSNTSMQPLILIIFFSRLIGPTLAIGLSVDIAINILSPNDKPPSTLIRFRSLTIFNLILFMQSQNLRDEITCIITSLPFFLLTDTTPTATSNNYFNNIAKCQAAT